MVTIIIFFSRTVRICTYTCVSELIKLLRSGEREIKNGSYKKLF